METREGKPEAGAKVDPVALKKAILQFKRDFDLHTLMIMKTEAIAKPAAQALAYSEGHAGIAKRLGK